MSAHSQEVTQMMLAACTLVPNTLTHTSLRHRGLPAHQGHLCQMGSTVAHPTAFCAGSDFNAL